MIIKNKKIKLINLINGTSFLTLPLISISAEGSPQVSKIRLNLSGITKNSFEITGSIGKAKIIFKRGLSIPKQVKFYKIIIMENDKAVKSKRFKNDNDLSEKNNNFYNLSNNKEVLIRLQIKDEYRDKYTFFWNNKEFFYKDIRWRVSGLEKAEVETTHLIASSFESSGTQGLGTITKKDKISIPPEVEITYAKEKTSGEEPLSRDYSGVAPSLLWDGDKVYIKFAIKSGFTSTHKLPDDFRKPIVFTFSGLKTEINTSELHSSFLRSYGIDGHNGSGILSINGEILNLPSQVELSYAVSDGNKPQTADYSSTPPSKLSNDDIIYVKFDIKSKYELTHKFPKNFKNSVYFTVDELKTLINPKNLVLSSFELKGHNGLGNLTIKKDVSLPLQVEVSYAVSDKGEPPKNTDYSSIPPSTLSNGNGVYIQFAVKSKHALTHELPKDFTGTIVFPVERLPKKDVLVSNLKVSSFEVSGNNGAGSLSINADLPPQVAMIYASSPFLVPDPNSLSFSSTMPSSLSNGDYVYIMFGIRRDDDSTHKLPDGFTNNPVVFTVSGLKTEVETTDLTAGSFEALGNEGEGVLTKIAIIPDQVQIKYAKEIGGKVPQESEYSDSLPTSLSNDDKVYIKFAIKRGDTSTHKLPDDFTNNPVVLTVSGLKTEVKTTDLTADSFQALGNEGEGVLTKIAIIPDQVQIKYAKEIGGKVPQESEYSDSLPTSLSNDDKVYIKFAIKRGDTSTHKLPDDFTNNPVVLTVSGLKTEVKTTDLTAGSFEALGNEGEGVLTKIAIIPDQVQIKYAKEIGGKVPQESEYSDSLPTSLSNDDKVYIKFAIKRGDTSTHKLPDGFTNNPVVFIVSGLKTEVKTTDLIADSFETSGAHGSGTITIKTSAKIPEQLEITYAKESENKAPPLEHYSQTAPRTLSNEDKVYVKFAIKEEHQETHKLPSNFENPIVLTTTSLNEIESPKESPKSEISESETKTSSNKEKKQAKKTKLSKGAIAGIVIGCILGVGAIGAFAAVKFLKIDVKKLMEKMKPKK